MSQTLNRCLGRDFFCPDSLSICSAPCWRRAVSVTGGLLRTMDPGIFKDKQKPSQWNDQTLPCPSQLLATVKEPYGPTGSETGYVPGGIGCLRGPGSDTIGCRSLPLGQTQQHHYPRR